MEGNASIDAKPVRVKFSQLAVCVLLVGLVKPTSAWSADRSGDGLVALYDFHLAKGSIVKDRSGVGKSLDLKIENPKNVRRAKGALEVRGKTLIHSGKPATKIVQRRAPFRRDHHRGVGASGQLQAGWPGADGHAVGRQFRAQLHPWPGRRQGGRSNANHQDQREWHPFAEEPQP